MGVSIQFNRLDWYWIVGGEGPHLPEGETEFPPVTQVFSSQAGDFVPVDDPAYVAWQSAMQASFGFDPTTRIDTVENLRSALQPYNITVPDPAAADPRK